jgi:hypothetical protein
MPGAQARAEGALIPAGEGEFAGLNRSSALLVTPPTNEVVAASR